MQCDKDYAEFSRVFPESIHDDQFENIWIYVKNQHGVDICFVLNETNTGDWSMFLETGEYLREPVFSPSAMRNEGQ